MAGRERPKGEFPGACRSLGMCHLVGSSRPVGDVEASLAQTIDPRLEQRPQRFWIERRTSRQQGIRAKVRFDFQQLGERNIRLFTPVKKRQRRCQYRVGPKYDRRTSDRALRVFHRSFIISQIQSRLSADGEKCPYEWVARAQPNRSVTFGDGLLHA